MVGDEANLAIFRLRWSRLKFILNGQKNVAILRLCSPVLQKTAPMLNGGRQSRLARRLSWRYPKSVLNSMAFFGLLFLVPFQHKRMKWTRILSLPIVEVSKAPFILPLQLRSFFYAKILFFFTPIGQEDAHKVN